MLRTLRKSAFTILRGRKGVADHPECPFKRRGREQARSPTIPNASLPFPIPTTTADLESLATQFNQYYKTDYSLADLDPDVLNSGDPTPKIANQSGGSISLLTTPTFMVGTTSGQFGSYVCIEMDDVSTFAAMNARRMWETDRQFFRL
jgi:hypothetical protein